MELSIAQMGWEKRKGRFYYYDAAWEDGRCVKRYRGTGLAGKAAAEQAAMRADRRALENIVFMKLSQRLEEAEALFTKTSLEADKLMKAGLLADDCYQASHTWRRRRQHER